MFLAAEPVSAGASLFNLLWPLVLMFAIFYFLLIRPQQKRQKQRNMMLLNLSKGDKIVTIGGIHATIVELTDDTAVIRVNDATKLTIDRSAINSVKSKEESSES
ncbi:preprotein translocase subunit YajC [Xylanibacillus composti]|nr:preprotein translocase subunit YajC [Xylanibacillus composti]